jgi:hypothetical protein
VGLSAAWLTRVSVAGGERGESVQTFCQLLFLASLAAVAATTMIALALGDGAWVLPAGTLGVMTIAATCDFRREAQIAS